MKSSLLIVFALIITLHIMSSGLQAQDWKKTDPGMNNVLIDTSLVRVTEAKLEPGEKSKMHTHPAHVFYALTEGKLTVHYSDGKEETFDLKPGDCGFSNPERQHETENVGKTTVKFLLVELKEHPYKK